MKRVLLALAFALAAAAAWVWVMGAGFEGALADEPPATPPSPQSVQRGEYLARAGNCVSCHTQRGGVPYAGGRPLATPFGTVFAGNLTPDAETGLGRWSAEAFWRALHEGRSRDGHLLYPAFPYNYYTQVTRADSDALFDYLRSLPPVRLPNRAHQLDWPYNTQAALAVWRALYFRAEPHADDPVQTAQWNRGAYLVRGLGHCGACHSARNALGATSDLMDLSGGLIPMQNWYAPSLSSPTEASVAGWSLQDIARLLQAGNSPRGSVLGPMAEVVLNSTQYLARADIDAMAVFLKSLPAAPTDTDPREVPVASRALMQRGEKLYRDHCVQCHGAAGEGVKGAYPPLARNRAVTMPVTANLVQVVLYGGYAPATQGNPRPFGMPPFALALGDADVAALLTYVRGSWNNRAAPVSELEVSLQRSSTQ